MSDKPTRMGIGGIAAGQDDETVPQEHATRLAEAAQAYHDPVAQLDGFMDEVRGTLEALRVSTAGNGYRIDAMERAVAQIQGQISQMELTFPQYAQAINTLDARVTAMAQQIARNFRLAALDAAVKAKGPGDPARNVLPMAKEFLEFLEPTVVPETPAADDERRLGNTLSH